jgi:hypothetical protein
MIRRNFSPILAICLVLPMLLFAGQALFARNWTDKRGRQIEAKFIRVDGDNVVLQKGSKPITVPFAQLSGEDQDYVRSLTEKKSKPKDSDDDNPFEDADDSPFSKSDEPKAKSTDEDNPFEEVGESPATKPAKQTKSKSEADDDDSPFQDADDPPAVKPKKPKAKSTDDDSASKKSADAPKPPPAEKPKPLPKTAKDRAADEIKNGEFAEREWSDKKGNKLKATFVRLEDSKVVLLQNGKERTFPMDQFTYDDKLYIRRAALEAQKHPKQIAKNDDPPARQPGPFSTGFPPPSYPGGNSAAETQRQVEEERRRQEAAQQQALVQQRLREAQAKADQDRQIQEERKRQEAVQRQAQEQERFQQSMAANTPPNTPSSNDPAPLMITVKSCMNCKKILPSTIKLGDCCPHCHAYLAYSKDSSGKVAYAPSSSSSIKVSLISTAILFLSIGFIVWLCRR